MLLCLNSKQHIMSEQIASRRDNDQHVEKTSGDYERIVKQKNHEYRRQRSVIRSQLISSPETWIHRITGPANRAFLTFVLLLVYRDEGSSGKKASANGASSALSSSAAQKRVIKAEVDAVVRRKSAKLENLKADMTPVVKRGVREEEMPEFMAVNRKAKTESKMTAPGVAVAAASVPSNPSNGRRRSTSTPPLDLSVRAVKSEPTSPMQQPLLHNPRALYLPWPVLSEAAAQAYVRQYLASLPSWHPCLTRPPPPVWSLGRDLFGQAFFGFPAPGVNPHSHV